MRRLICAVLVIFASSRAVSPAEAQDRRLPSVPAARTVAGGGRRVALIVGNDAYAETPLRNAVNDARAIDAVLRELGFDVETLTDAGLHGMEDALDRLATRLGRGDVGFFYFAGHGIQLDGKNYLLPVDFAAKGEREAKRAALDADAIHDRMIDTGASVNILVLDACRNNPFKGSRGTGGGLAKMEGARGSYIAFATAPGSTASDDPGSSNGLFTKHLVGVLREPGLTVDQVFTRVRARVNEESHEKQLPWSSTSLLGEVILKPGAAPVAQAGGGIAEADLARLRDLDDWRAAQRSGKAESLRAYLDSHPEGAFRPDAEAALARMKSESPEAKRQERSVRIVTADPLLQRTVRIGLEQPLNGAGIAVAAGGGPSRYVLKLSVPARQPGRSEGALSWACDVTVRWTLLEGSHEVDGGDVSDRAVGATADAACEQAVRKTLTELSEGAGRSLLRQ